MGSTWEEIMAGGEEELLDVCSNARQSVRVMFGGMNRVFENVLAELDSLGASIAGTVASIGVEHAEEGGTAKAKETAPRELDDISYKKLETEQLKQVAMNLERCRIRVGSNKSAVEKAKEISIPVEEKENHRQKEAGVIRDTTAGPPEVKNMKANEPEIIPKTSELKKAPGPKARIQAPKAVQPSPSTTSARSAAPARQPPLSRVKLSPVPAPNLTPRDRPPTPRGLNTAPAPQRRFVPPQRGWPRDPQAHEEKRLTSMVADDEWESEEHKEDDVVRAMRYINQHTNLKYEYDAF